MTNNKFIATSDLYKQLNTDKNVYPLEKDEDKRRALHKYVYSYKILKYLFISSLETHSFDTNFTVSLEGNCGESKMKTEATKRLIRYKRR